MKRSWPLAIPLAVAVLAGWLYPRGAALQPLAAPAADSALAVFKAGLELLTRDGGTWRASNAEYADADGGTTAYATRYRLQPGGVSATGCLWGERAGGRQVHWHFFVGWDPVQRRGLFYQSGADGRVGIGHEVERAGDRSTVEQTFVVPGGASWRGRHVSVERGDTTVTHSFEWQAGAWAPRRTYTWLRVDPSDTPC